MPLLFSPWLRFGFHFDAVLARMVKLWEASGRRRVQCPLRHLLVSIVVFRLLPELHLLHERGGFGWGLRRLRGLARSQFLLLLLLSRCMFNLPRQVGAAGHVCAGMELASPDRYERRAVARR